MHKGGVAYIRFGNLPDSFIERHNIQTKQSEYFLADRSAAKLSRKVKNYINTNSEIKLPDGKTISSSKIINYNPVRLIFITDNGVTGYEIDQLSRELQLLLDYSIEAAEEYREFLKEEEKRQKQYLAEIRLLESKKRMASIEYDKLASLRAKAKKSTRSYSSKPFYTSSKSTSSYSSSDVWVRGYTRSDGTYVRGHWRSR